MQEKKRNADEVTKAEGWKFSDILAFPEIKARWNKVRKYFFLRESTYDMTNRCNIRCEGCYYYKGEKQFARENKNVEDWRALMESEKNRGITFVVLAGAEPSLVPELCEVCYHVIPYGAIATNGLRFIPETVGYRIHVSVWGNDETSYQTRKAPDMLKRQVENYRDDQRAVFVYTFTRHNIDEAAQVTEILAQNGCKITFNMFSSPVGYQGNLSHTAESLKKTRSMAMELIEAYPKHVIFSRYNAVAHTHRLGLHDLYKCQYPRVNPSTDLGLGRSFRQYRTDLTWDRDAACCVPDTDCPDCRHYASGSAIVTARLFRHATDPETFSAWLDYTDTYLAVWVMGYEKDPDLCQKLVQPPGQNLF